MIKSSVAILLISTTCTQIQFAIHCYDKFVLHRHVLKLFLSLKWCAIISVLNESYFLHFQKRMPMGKRFGKYVFIMYMFTKVLYIANAVVQIFILNSILGKRLMTTSLHMLYTLYQSHLCIWPLAIFAFL